MFKETFEFPFGKFYAHETHIVGEPNYGVNLGIPEARIVINTVASRYTKPWGYIGNRLNGNSVDPFVYIFAREEAPLFHTMAIVAHTKATMLVASIEEVCIRSAKLQFGIFVDLDVANQWVVDSIQMCMCSTE